MDVRLIGLIIVLVLLLVISGIIYYAYTQIRKKVRSYSRMLFGTPSVREGFQQIEREESITPKSVASATGLYLPAIMRDFPEFHYDEMKTRAENVLTSFLRSIDEAKESILTEGTQELRDHLELRLKALENEDKKEHFKSIRIHRTEIHQYRKTKGRCSVVFQSSVEYFHYLEKDGQILMGSRDKMEQTRYNIEVIYIQDRDYVENIGDAGLGLNCPNCGAPLPGLAAKKCAYCDTPVVEFNIRTWNFSSVVNISK